MHTHTCTRNFPVTQEEHTTLVEVLGAVRGSERLMALPEVPEVRLCLFKRASMHA